MAEELGKIEKPEAGRFAGKRKLYLVTLLYTSEAAPADYVEIFERYWQQVDEHLRNLELKAGRSSHVYHESVILSGEAGLQLLQSLNSASHRIAQQKCQSGAVLEMTEDREMADECLDWGRCLMLGFMSEKVARTVSESYVAVAKKRFEYIAGRIDETLKEAESGILFIQEGHLVQFPQDIEVFIVSPPALDEFRRWQREQRSATAPEPDENAESSETEH